MHSKLVHLRTNTSPLKEKKLTTHKQWQTKLQNAHYA